MTDTYSIVRDIYGDVILCDDCDEATLTCAVEFTVILDYDDGSQAPASDILRVCADCYSKSSEYYTPFQR